MKNLFTLFVAILCAAAIHAANYSGTLPVLHINTENSTPITSKEYYLNGTYYLDNLGIEGYKSIGSANEPLTLKIKGRGNYTFTGFDKKPYRLKLDAKAALLGMKKSKHFALLAHADDNLGFLRNTMGFELSRRGGLDFTPEQRPVEVVLNGEYIGLYFLTETIRVDANRWPNYGNRNMENAKNEFMKMLHAKVSWLKKQWGESGITGTEENALNVTVADGGQLLFSGNVDSATAFDLSGRPANIELTSPTTARIDGMAGIYIVRLQTASSAKTVKVVIPQ